MRPASRVCGGTERQGGWRGEDRCAWTRRAGVRSLRPGGPQRRGPSNHEDGGRAEGLFPIPRQFETASRLPWSAPLLRAPARPAGRVLPAAPAAQGRPRPKVSRGRSEVGMSTNPTPIPGNSREPIDTWIRVEGRLIGPFASTESASTILDSYARDRKASAEARRKAQKETPRGPVRTRKSKSIPPEPPRPGAFFVTVLDLTPGSMPISNPYPQGWPRNKVGDSPRYSRGGMSSGNVFPSSD